MRELVLMIATLMLAGCYMAEHYGGVDEKLKVQCAGGCAVYKADASGCEKFHAGTSAACSRYFDAACKSSPGQCRESSKP